MKLKLLEKLGGGGFADVWLARDDELEREVAVKIIREASLGASDALAHAKALARANHPNVVTIFDIVKITDPDTCAEVDCVVMELLQGVTLARRLESEDISLSEVQTIGIGIIEGLSHIHAKGMTHGDLHEENVMVVGDTSKVIDILYLNSLASLSTQKQDAKFKRDLRNLRDLLQQLIIQTKVDTIEFNNLGSGATIDDIRAVFVQTLTSANTNKEAIKATEVTLRATLRPWVSVELGTMGPLVISDTGEIRFSMAFNLKNVGKSPALYVDITSKLLGFMDKDGISPQEKLRALCQERRQMPFSKHSNYGHTIFQDESLLLKIGMVTTVEELKKCSYMDNPEYFAIDLIGCISYRTTFDDGMHLTQFMGQLRKHDPDRKGLFLSFRFDEKKLEESQYAIWMSPFESGRAD